MVLVTDYDMFATRPVMPGLVPGIHVYRSREGVDGRNKSGHDE
jgi:hypothetical protein